MPTLAVAVNANKTLFSMDEALPAGTKFLRVEDELVRIQSIAYRIHQRIDPDPLLCTVIRGVEGTVAVSHDEGTELEPYVDAYATPTPFSASSASADVQFKRVDAVVAFDTPAITTGIELFTLPVDALVISLSFFIETTINADAGLLTVSFLGEEAPGNFNGDSPAAMAFSWIDLAGVGFARLLEASPVEALHSGNPWTQGSVRVVAIYAEAAAA